MGSALSKDQVVGEILQDGASAQVYAYIPVSSIDEVRIGQEVQVLIEGFSLREYGKLEGGYGYPSNARRRQNAPTN